MRPISVLVFDDNNGELQAVCASIQRMFDRQKIKIDVLPHLIDSKSPSVETVLLKIRPEVVVIDNHIDDSVSGQMYGQTVISDIKERFPDSVFVMMTKVSVKNDTIAQKFPFADLLVSKHGLEMGYDDYASWFVKEISSRVTRARVGDIEYDSIERSLAGLSSKSLRGKSRGVTKQDLASLVQQVCYTGGMPEENVIEAVRLQPLTGGASDAIVCTMYIKNRYSDYSVPSALKIMKSEAARREAHNHAKFVKWVLPYRWRVDIIGRGQTDAFGAVCYSFAHGGTGAPETLSSIIAENNNKRVLDIFNQLLNPKSQAWYSQCRTTVRPLAVYLASTPPYFTKAADEIKRQELLYEQINLLESEDNFRFSGKGAQRLLIFDEQHVDIGNVWQEFFNIRDILETEECLSHGDMNSGNILVRKDSDEFCFIDFQHTGWHHRARDFCSLEGSVRTLQFEADKRTLVERVRDEIAAWQRCEERKFDGHGPFVLIDELRSKFFENHKGSALELAMANFVHCWWMLSFDSWNVFQRKRLIAFFVGCIVAIKDRIVTAKI